MKKIFLIFILFLSFDLYAYRSPEEALAQCEAFLVNGTELTHHCVSTGITCTSNSGYANYYGLQALNANYAIADFVVTCGFYASDCGVAGGTFVQGSCVMPVQCPDSGIDRDITFCSPLFPDTATSGKKVNMNSGGQPTVSDSDGCTYTSNDKWYDNSGYKGVAQDGTDIYCMTQNYTSTGNSGPVPAEEYDQGYTDDSNPDALNDAIHDYYENYNPDTLTNNPDGSTDFIESGDSGVDYGDTFTQSPDTITDSTGGGYSDSTVKTTHTNADGSKTVTTSSTGSSSTPGRTICNKRDGSCSNLSGVTSNHSSTGTESFGTDGTQTGSTSTTTNPINNPYPSNPDDKTDENASDLCDTAEEDCEDFKEILSEGSGDFSETGDFKSMMEGKVDEIEDHENVPSDYADWFENSGISTTLDDTFNSLVPSGSCSDYVISTGSAGHDLVLTCADSAIVREILSYAMYVLLALFSFQTLTYPVKG